MSKRAKIRQQHDERVICALKQLGMPATESVIASAARLPPHITMKALKRLIESGRVISVMSEWGRVLPRKGNAINFERKQSRGFPLAARLLIQRTTHAQ